MATTDAIEKSNYIFSRSSAPMPKSAIMLMARRT
jgi:hypothetical protein